MSKIGQRRKTLQQMIPQSFCPAGKQKSWGAWRNTLYCLDDHGFNTWTPKHPTWKRNSCQFRCLLSPPSLYHSCKVCSLQNVHEFEAPSTASSDPLTTTVWRAMEQADGNNVHIFFSCNTIQKFITVALLTLGQNPKMYLYLICCSGSPQSFLEIWQAHWKVMTLEWTIKVNFRTEFLSTQFRRLQCIPNYRWILRKT